MGALELDRMTWPEVKAALQAGHDTVVVAFGATEQHGPHLPLATDALIGDHLSRLVAERLGAFRAPTVRIGCSEHHLAFPGTLSVSADTFAAIVADVLSSLARGGFKRAILLPTHGGNFAPLAAAIDKAGPIDGLEVRALTDLMVLLATAQIAATSTACRSARAGSTPASGRPRCCWQCTPSSSISSAGSPASLATSRRRCR
jgi:creatinine amidohydrolase